MSERIYCISGLGADEKIFANLSIPGFELVHVPWLRPEKREQTPVYAQRMAAQIGTVNPILLGVSFGGMMGIEIAKLMPLKQLFIVSSVKGRQELPAWMKCAGTLQLNKILPVKSNRFTEGLDNRTLGVSNAAELAMVRHYRKTADPVYINWAINEVLNWKNDWQPEGIVHIHGTKDRMFPVKKIRNAQLIEGGTHLMIYNRAPEIAAVINTVLRSRQ